MTRSPRHRPSTKIPSFPTVPSTGTPSTMGNARFAASQMRLQNPSGNPKRSVFSFGYVSFAFHRSFTTNIPSISPSARNPLANTGGTPITTPTRPRLRLPPRLQQDLSEPVYRIFAWLNRAQQATSVTATPHALIRCVFKTVPNTDALTVLHTGMRSVTSQAVPKRGGHPLFCSMALRFLRCRPSLHRRLLCCHRCGHQLPTPLHHLTPHSRPPLPTLPIPVRFSRSPPPQSSLPLITRYLGRLRHRFKRDLSSRKSTATPGSYHRTALLLSRHSSLLKLSRCCMKRSSALPLRKGSASPSSFGELA